MRQIEFNADGTGTPDAFISKLNSAGNALAYSTYLGGNSIDHARGIAIDSAGAAYVTGFTFSSDFNTVGADRGPLRPFGRVRLKDRGAA